MTNQKIYLERLLYSLSPSLYFTYNSKFAFKFFLFIIYIQTAIGHTDLSATSIKLQALNQAQRAKLTWFGPSYKYVVLMLSPTNWSSFFKLKLKHSRSSSSSIQYYYIHYNVDVNALGDALGGSSIH